jgi:4-hydroxy-2-oxoheptanedioate aldolase
MAPRNPMLECMQSGRTALEVWANDPETVELCAFLGLDWIMIDMMFTGMDFRDVQNMIRTCEAAGITPVVRAHSDPWLGYDHRIAVDLSRLQGIGAQFILVSHSGIREIEEALEVAKDWHRRALWVHPFRNRAEWDRRIDAMHEGAYIIPHAESLGSVEKLDETMDLPGLKMFFFGMTDLSKVLANSKSRTGTARSSGSLSNAPSRKAKNGHRGWREHQLRLYHGRDAPAGEAAPRRRHGVHHDSGARSSSRWP